MSEFAVCLTADDQNYIRHAELACAAWKKFFPECNVALTLLTNHNARDTRFRYLYKYIDYMHTYKYVDGYDIDVQAKLAMLLALTRKHSKKINMLVGIDQVILQKRFIVEMIEQNSNGKLTAVGKHLYDADIENKGKFPSAYMFGEPDVFVNLINPEELSLHGMCEKFRSLKVFDTKESTKKLYGNAFSDESLLRVLLSNSKCIKHIARTYNDTDVIDRSNWKINIGKLRAGGYAQAHLPRNVTARDRMLLPIRDYIGV